jgi:hypothetical protein
MVNWLLDVGPERCAFWRQQCGTPLLAAKSPEGIVSLNWQQCDRRVLVSLISGKPIECTRRAMEQHQYVAACNMRLLLLTHSSSTGDGVVTLRVCWCIGACCCIAPLVVVTASLCSKCVGCVQQLLLSLAAVN